MKLIRIIKEIGVEVTKPNIFQAIVAKQYDMNSRFLKVTFMDSGTRIDIPKASTISVVINAERNDGQSKGFDGEVNDDGTVTVPLHSWMLELEGTVNCDISVIDRTADAEKKLTTTTFALVVEKAAYGGDDITSDPQYDVFVDLLERVENLAVEGGVVADQNYNPESTYAQSGKAVADAVAGAEYFNIETDGTISLKPEYRGATIKFADDSTILNDLGSSVCAEMLRYATSDNDVGKEGSKINSLPETLYIPSSIGGMAVTKLAPAMFAYNKRVKQVVLPLGIAVIPNECFAYTIHLESIKNVESVTSINYGSFCASRIVELDVPNLTALDKKTFMKAGHLKRIHLGKITEIPTRCFHYCTNLEEITHDENFKITSVGEGAFFLTNSLKSADFVEDLRVIGSYAFNRCALNFDWLDFYNRHTGSIEHWDISKATDNHSLVFDKVNNIIRLIDTGENYTKETLGELCPDLKDGDTAILTWNSGEYTYIALWGAEQIDYTVENGNHRRVYKITPQSLNNQIEISGMVCSIENFSIITEAETVTYGTRATPIQSNPSILTTTDFDFFNIETKACELPAPLRIEQDNPKWSAKPLGNMDTFSTGCMFFSVMNAYCGMRGLNYDEPYSLVDINEACPIPDGYITEEASGATLNDAFTKTKENNRYPTRYGEIVKYIGTNERVTIKAYIHHNDKSIPTRTVDTDKVFINGHNYRLSDTYDKTTKERTWTWVDLGTRELTNMDLFASGNYTTTEQWFKGLGFNTELSIWQTPAEYPKIIEALQNGSYVVLNVPNAYNSLNGHAILLYGVKANGEVMFVDSSVPALLALEDYRAITGSMFLQNLIPENGGVYNIISEGETKTLLNETVDNKIADALADIGGGGEIPEVDLSSKMDKFGEVTSDSTSYTVTAPNMFYLNSGSKMTLTTGGGPIRLSASSIQVSAKDGQSVGKLSNLAAPVNDTDATNKKYVDETVADAIDGVIKTLENYIAETLGGDY